jgi:predicted CoA-binding protein
MASAHRSTQADITAFFSSQAYAVIGVSANRRKFGNTVFRMMKEKGFTVYPVHPTLGTVEGEPCFRSVGEVPFEVQSAVTVVPPDVTAAVVKECQERGIRQLWMQPGSGSPAAEALARESGMTVVNGECILMFLEPVESVHALHRWLKKLVGTYPA